MIDPVTFQVKTINPTSEEARKVASEMMTIIFSAKDALKFTGVLSDSDINRLGEAAGKDPTTFSSTLQGMLGMEKTGFQGSMAALETLNRRIAKNYVDKAKAFGYRFDAQDPAWSRWGNDTGTGEWIGVRTSTNPAQKENQGKGDGVTTPPARELTEAEKRKAANDRLLKQK